MACATLVSEFSFGLHPHLLDSLNVDVVMHWMDKVLSVNDNLVIAHRIVDG